MACREAGLFSLQLSCGNLFLLLNKPDFVHGDDLKQSKRRYTKKRKIILSTYHKIKIKLYICNRNYMLDDLCLSFRV